MDKPKQTLVEEGTELKGTLKSRCQVVVNGSIDGQIEAPSLTVTRTGSVLGVVRAQKLHSEGVLAGDIDADKVFLSGTVRSNTIIRAKTLEVKLSQDKGKIELTFGECLLEVGEDPAHAEVQASKPPEEPSVLAPPAALSMVGDSNPTANWSEPPVRDAADAQSSPEAQAGSSSAESGETENASWTPGDDLDDLELTANGQKRKKRNKGRESQIPPA